ncbi:hypothetical protein [Streptomyces sp. NPDC060022]|uniref:hypothetical protein n=1 Tax=Streptomyces sp. NPDC060022 TaxID=3347039 RepID=UPI0036836A84
MPSPIAHRTVVTFAVAVTVTPPAVAVADAGPDVVGVLVAHIHIGMPTTYVPARRAGAGTFGPSRRIEAAARRATTSGSMVGAAGPSSPFGTKTTPPRPLSHWTL